MDIPGEKERTRPREGGSRTVDKDGKEVKPAQPAAKPKKSKETPPTEREGE
jgi:hypothetical protein